MIYSELHRKTGKISKIGLGTVQFGMDYGFTKAKTQDEVNAILAKSKELGINFIDTARAYGDSEEKIGRYLKVNRGHEYLVETKIALIKEDIAVDKEALRKHIFASIDTSRNNLGQDKLDIFMSHQSDDYLIENEYFWGAVREAREKGSFGHFGVSFYDTEQAEKVLKSRAAEVDFVQVPYNVFDQRFESVFPKFRDKGINVVTRSVFLKGIVAVDNSRVPAELKDILVYKNRLADIAKDTGLSNTELALLFVISSPAVHTTIIGTDSSKEIELNAAILEKIEKIKAAHKEMKSLNIKDRSLIDPRRWKQL